MGASDSPADSPEAVAALLGRTLEGDCWFQFTVRTDDPSSRALMTRRALDLFDRTAPCLASLDPGAWDTPVAFAVGVLREIGNGYAMLSNSSTRAERERLELPNHPWAASVIRSHGVDEWASNIGHPIELGTSNADDEIRQSPVELSEPEEMTRNLTAHFCGVIRDYEKVLGLRRREAGRELLRRSDFRDAACRDIDGSREWNRSALARFPSTSAPQAAAGILTLIAQGVYVASHDTTDSTVLFPDETFLRGALHRTGAYDWLIRAGARLPEWAR
jgi:hypothetical protein